MESHKVLQDVTNTELPINMKGKSSWKDENLENLDEVLENQEMFKLSKSTDAIQDRPTKIRKKTGRIPPPLTIPQVHTDCVGEVTPEEDLNLPSYVSNLPFASPPNGFQSSFPAHVPFPPFFSPLAVDQQVPGVQAVVESPGFIRLRLRENVLLDLSSDMSVHLQNQRMNSSMAISSCSSQMALVHPKGRILVYSPRVEMQCEDEVSVKNAKFYPRGVSFTANNMALVYLLDEAGARSTSDMFHDLYATEISCKLFDQSLNQGNEAISNCIYLLENAQYWRTAEEVDCWIFGQLFIKQTQDGMVIIEKLTESGKVILKASPSNGKVKFESSFIHLTASLGPESHIFLKSHDRRLHYNGESKQFVVRCAGHSAGFDMEGQLRLF